MYGIAPREFICKNCGYEGSVILEQIKENNGSTD